MQVHKILICTTLVLGLGVAAASADEQEASSQSCIKMSEKVQAALDSNEQSPNYADASKERLSGREFCSNGFYSRGIAHYARALQLLGVSDQGVAQKN